MEESKSAFEILKCKPVGKILLRRPRRRWRLNVRINLK